MIWYLMPIIVLLSIILITNLIPHPRAKVEHAKQFITIHAKERGISTSIGARADDSTANFDFIIVILKNLFIQPSRFQVIKKYFKKRLKRGL